MSVQLASHGFREGTPIPVKYTCDGTNVSPALIWTNAPQATKSFALIADDPDAPSGTWVHWVLYSLAPAITELPEGIAPTETVLDGAKQGINDFGRIGYGGPCLPRGKPHL